MLIILRLALSQGELAPFGVNYLETYAPVVDFSIVRISLYFVVFLSLFVAQVDIITEFLNGNLEEDVWVRYPRGIPGLSFQTFKLKKALYGIRQAHGACHKKLCNDFGLLGFEEIGSVPYMFPSAHGSFRSVILVHLHDLLIYAESKKEVDQIVDELKSLYKFRRFEKVDLFWSETDVAL